MPISALGLFAVWILLFNVLAIRDGRSTLRGRRPCGFIRTFPLAHECRQVHLNSNDARLCVRAEERFYKMITDKYAQVDRLLHDHKDPNDRLQLRLNYVECTANHKLGEMLRRHSTDRAHSLSIIADMKRRTPTHNPKCDNTVLSYVDAAEVAKNMASVGFDAIFINTDDTVYGGHISELHKCFLELRKLGRRTRPAIVMKDLILHPIQIAQAAEYRADGVVLNAAILGNALKDMIAACVTMGIEAVVEVHTGADAMRALDMGTTHLLVNQWDRIENVLRPSRALEVKEIVGDDATLIAAGGLINFNQIHELGLIGYDAIVLGRKLAHNDVPQLVEQIKMWRAPCKSILRMSKDMFFDIKQNDEDGAIDISLRDDNVKLFNEMNAFYHNESVDVAKILASENDDIDSLVTQSDAEHCQTSGSDTNCDDGKEKVVTLTCGNPTTTTFVKNILSTPECPDSMVDANAYFSDQISEMYQMKWYVEREKWVKRFRQHFNSRRDAEKAHELKKAIEVYTAYKLLGPERMRATAPKQDVEQLESTLMESIKRAYSEAPRNEHGDVIMPE